MIKNFIYLDEYKMYSLSSQIFEGITEYLVSTSKHENAEENTQRGEIGSGRILADIIKKTNTTQEKKYLHDYSYTIFEKHLLESDRIVDINNVDTENFLSSITSKSFIKITGKVIFNDIGHMSKTIKDFNLLGEALLVSQSLNDPSITTKNLKKIAKQRGLNFDKKFLDSLSYILDFGFGNQLEVQLQYNDYLFSTNLKREYLRENENLLIKKYARKTEKEFTLLGIITQYQNTEEEEDTDTTPEHLKVAVMNLVSKFTNLELTFTGKLENEIMIDPIAIYTEL